MVQISRVIAFFALVSTGLALATNSDATTSAKGVSAGNSDETAVHNGGIEKVKMNDHDTLVNSEFSGSTANSGSDAIAVTTFAEDKAVVNATSAGVAEPGVVKIAAGTEAIRPGSSVYIQNNQGYYLTRFGATGLIFGKTSPDVFCKFRADGVTGTDYVVLRSDDNLAITLDRTYNPPPLWLNRLFPFVWFQAVSAGEGKYYLVIRNPDDAPLTVTGSNFNGGAISTIRDSSGFNGLYIIPAL
ncbi:hypothetical protein B0H19DRAFT_1379060 [Mycena capillaripes]|nr:hypothetical protein B0H19DRAFT_1379060 [Mycena capillaripes]